MQIIMAPIISGTLTCFMSLLVSLNWLPDTTSLRQKYSFHGPGDLLLYLSQGFEVP